VNDTEKPLHEEKQFKPWNTITDLIEQTDEAELLAFLRTLSSSETAWAISRLDQPTREQFLSLLNPQDGARVLHELPEDQAVELIDNVAPSIATAIIHELPSDEKVDILNDLHESEKQAILEELPTEEAEETKALMQYPERSAGGLMSTEFLAFPQTMTVNGLLEDLNVNQEEYSDYEVQYAFVLSANDTLTGVLPLRNVLLSAREKSLESLMIANPISVNVQDDLEKLLEEFEAHDFLGIPIVDDANRMVGLAHRAKVMSAAENRSSDSYLKASGIVGGEELRSMSLWLRSYRRFSWLSINIVLNIVAASVIALYQDTLASVIVLAVFLPIISDMSGCSGNQAVAVSIRELTLGLVKPYEVGRVFLKEISVGVINGAALGLILGVVAILWQGNVYLGLVVGGAMMLNTIIAVSLGGLIPLMLKKFGKDPALASGPLLTTVTDLCGFFLVLSFAQMALPLLVN
jgi:magnesium transporter